MANFKRKGYNVGKAVKEFYINKQLIDATVVVAPDLDNDAAAAGLDVKPNIVIGAHRLILAAGSGYFHDGIMNCISDEVPIRIELPNIRYSDMMLLLQFLYSGSVILPEEKKDTFLAMAKELRVHGLDVEDAGNVTSTSNGGGPAPKKRRKSGKNVKTEQNVKTEPVGVKSEPGIGVKSEPSDNDGETGENWDDDDDDNENGEEEKTDAGSPSGVLRLAGSTGGRCVVCGRLFNDVSNARKHYQRMHAAQADMACCVCGRLFGNRVAWAGHLREAHRVTQKMLREAQDAGHAAGAGLAVKRDVRAFGLKKGRAQGQPE